MADSSDVSAGVNATATQYNNLRKDVVLGQLVQGTETYAATTDIDFTSLIRGKVRTVTLTGNTIFTFTGAVAGQVLYLRIVQDATGSRTVTWPSGIKWPGGVAPTLSTTANKIDTICILCTATGPVAYDAGLVFSSLS